MPDPVTQLLNQYGVQTGNYNAAGYTYGYDTWSGYDRGWQGVLQRSTERGLSTASYQIGGYLGSALGEAANRGIYNLTITKEERIARRQERIARAKDQAELYRDRSEMRQIEIDNARDGNRGAPQQYGTNNGYQNTGYGSQQNYASTPTSYGAAPNSGQKQYGTNNTNAGASRYNRQRALSNSSTIAASPLDAAYQTRNASTTFAAQTLPRYEALKTLKQELQTLESERTALGNNLVRAADADKPQIQQEIDAKTTEIIHKNQEIYTNVANFNTDLAQLQTLQTDLESSLQRFNALSDQLLRGEDVSADLAATRQVIADLRAQVRFFDKTVRLELQDQLAYKQAELAAVDPSLKPAVQAELNAIQATLEGLNTALAAFPPELMGGNTNATTSQNIPQNTPQQGAQATQRRVNSSSVYPNNAQLSPEEQQAAQLARVGQESQPVEIPDILTNPNTKNAQRDYYLEQLTQTNGTQLVFSSPEERDKTLRPAIRDRNGNITGYEEPNFNNLPPVEKVLHQSRQFVDVVEDRFTDFQRLAQNPATQSTPVTQEILDQYFPQTLTIGSGTSETRENVNKFIDGKTKTLADLWKFADDLVKEEYAALKTQAELQETTLAQHYQTVAAKYAADLARYNSLVNQYKTGFGVLDNPANAYVRSSDPNDPRDEPEEMWGAFIDYRFKEAYANHDAEIQEMLTLQRNLDAQFTAMKHLERYLLDLQEIQRVNIKSRVQVPTYSAYQPSASTPTLRRA